MTMAGSAIASRGDGIYLIDLGNGLGAILHTGTEPSRLWPSQSIASIAKFGYWEELPEDFDQREISAALARAEHVGTPSHRLMADEWLP
jgi:hypothetical protein